MTEFSESVLGRALGFNPCVAGHELRMRMRGVRPFVVLFFYAAVAAAAALLTLVTAEMERRAMYGGPGSSAPLGRTTLSVLAYTQLTLICLIIPAYAAGAITMEREKRTLEMLRATLLSPSDVVSGKYLVVLAFAAVLLATSVPVAAWSLMLGGAAPEEVLYVYSYLFAVAALVGALGLLLSALTRRSIGAIVGTYGIVLFFMVAAPIIVYSAMIPIMFASSLRPGATVPPTFGLKWSLIILGFAGLVCAWLLFLAARWTWQRFTGRGRGWVGRALAAAIAVCVLVFLGAWCGPRALAALKKASVMWVGIVNAYFSLSGIMDGMFAHMVTTSGPGMFMPGGASGAQTQIWAVAFGSAIVTALALWALAVRAFRARA